MAGLAERAAENVADPREATDQAFAGMLASQLGPSPSPAEVSKPTVQTASATPATPAAQLANSVLAHARPIGHDGAVEFRLRLDPPELGRVQVHLVTDGSGVSGHVVVADDAVRQVIASQLPELRQRLEAAGLTVQRFEVSADPGGGGGRGGYQTWAEPLVVDRPTPAAGYLVATPARAAGLDVTV